MIPLAIWNENINKTVNVSIYGTVNQGAPPSPNEIWPEILYYGTTGSLAGVRAWGGIPNIMYGGHSGVTGPGMTGANGTGCTGPSGPWAADTTSTWNGGGGGAGWSPFVMTIPLDGTKWPKPSQPGMIQVAVHCLGPGGAPSPNAYYIDPKIVLS
jgi:hypothetical protein